MVSRSFLLSLLLCSYFSLSLGDDVTVTVKGVTTIAKTDDTFVCATLDWWPPSKCNYNMCPWEQAGLLNLNLSNPILPKAIKAFNSLRLRLGGSLQDQMLYNVNGTVRKCHYFKKKESGLFGFSNGCLNMDRWDALYELFSSQGAVLTFGLNALIGRKKANQDPKDTLYIGNWNPSNTRAFMQYILSKGQKIDSWEFGNELCGGGIAAKVEPKQYGEDMIILRKLVDELYQNSGKKPQIMAPGGFFEKKWFDDFLLASGPNVVDVVSHHIYNLGAGVDPTLFDKMQDPYHLDEIVQTYNDLEVTLKEFSPWSSAWVSESGGAYNSGGKLISHAFINSFWFLDQLGMTSTYNHKVFCRQTLIGGNYGLLNTTTMVPNPDYYSALLFHRLMGRGVLATNHNGSPYLRAYTHCRRNGAAGVTLLLINLSNSTSFNVSLANDLNLYPPLEASAQAVAGAQRDEYHLTAKDGDLKSTTMLLNGSPLELTENGDIPDLKPTQVDSSKPVSVAQSSIVFAVFKDFKAPAC
ncbi:heparanase-like protein 2 [Magnolia sinica]|uniref:heparanase-like protein 2 n=1 Tax=Magnolia sinica TaxID=86752 RepID=UPI002659C002|nr:heparanase-like protein 2 [Magnolia sinica]